MAVDFQTIHPQEAIRLNRIRMRVVGGLKVLDIIGSDFRAVDEVQINETQSPDIIVLSKTRLLAQLPDRLQDNPDVQNVNVLSKTLTISTKSVLRFRIGDTPGKVVGILRLLQLFVKILISDPGSDIFNKGLGAGALANLGSSFGEDEGQNIKADFTIAVDRAARQVVAIQSRNSSIPRDERLLSAKVLGTTFSRATASLFVTVEVISQDGTPARVNLEV